MSLTTDITVFSERLSQRLRSTLPGAIAHEPMRATPVGKLRPVFEHKLPPKAGAVLILIYPAGNDLFIPLTQRADYLGVHGGQISFPGGKREEGEDAVANALRECEEEIGVNPEEITVIGKLTDFFVIPSNFIVTPVVGIAKSKPAMKADPVEVTGILACSITALIKDDAIHEKEIIAAKQFHMHAPHFEIQANVVWGATAMMLNEFRLIVREAFK